MKINEALIIGAGLLVALVLSKSQDLTSNIKEFSGKSSVSVLPIENKTKIISQINIIPKTISEITKIIITPPKITQIDITDQLKNIFNIETEKKNERVSYLQNELDQTEKFIEKQYGIVNFKKVYNKYDTKKAYLYESDVQRISNLTGKEKGDYTSEDVINYYENLVKSEAALGYGGGYTGGAFRKFPKVTAALTNYYNNLIVKQTAQESIKPAEIYADQQQEGINKVLNEYTTRFGGLSRYD